MTTRTSIREMLTRDLGFCCPWAALEANREHSSNVLADRLGVSGRAIRYQWDKVVSGETKCERRSTCMKGKLDANARKKV